MDEEDGKGEEPTGKSGLAPLPLSLLPLPHNRPHVHASIRPHHAKSNRFGMTGAGFPSGACPMHRSSYAVSGA